MFFFAKIDIFYKSIGGPLSEAYTQPRISLISCQIRYELSVTIHEISTSWKKTLDGGPYIWSTFQSLLYYVICYGCGFSLTAQSKTRTLDTDAHEALKIKANDWLFLPDLQDPRIQ